MPDLSDEELRKIFGEVLSDQLQAILEYLSVIPSIQADMAEWKQRTYKSEQIFLNNALDILNNIDRKASVI